MNDPVRMTWTPDGMSPREDGEFVLVEDFQHKLAEREVELENTTAGYLACSSLLETYKAKLAEREAQVGALTAALGAIAEALREPSGGTYFAARGLLDRIDVYNDDLDGERVLGLLARTYLAKPPIAAFVRLLEAVKDVVANTGCGSDVDEACASGECGHIDQTEELLDAIARLKEAARDSGLGGAP